MKERDHQVYGKERCTRYRTLLAKGAVLPTRQVSRLMRKRASPRADGNLLGNSNGISRPLLNHGSGGCSGFEPDSLLIDSAYSIANRIGIQFYPIIHEDVSKCNLKMVTILHPEAQKRTAAAIRFELFSSEQISDLSEQVFEKVTGVF